MQKTSKAQIIGKHRSFPDLRFGCDPRLSPREPSTLPTLPRGDVLRVKTPRLGGSAATVGIEGPTCDWRLFKTVGILFARVRTITADGGALGGSVNVLRPM